MKVGILGSGSVGQALGTGFVTLGHDVKVGTRDPGTGKLTAWVKKTGPKASAASFGDAAAFGELAVLATAWAGTENAIKLADPKHLAGKVLIDATNPLKFAPNKATVTDILKAFGWDVIDIGGIEGARYLEPLAMVWILHGFRTNSWSHAFKLLRKP